MNQLSQTSRFLGVLALGLGTLVCTGCSTLMGRSKGPLDNLDVRSMKAAGYTFGKYGAEKPILTENGEPCVVLEVTNGKRHFEKIPLPEGQSMFVSDIIRDAQLFKKIGKMKVSVLRPNGANKPPVRLDVDFDDKGKNVMEGQNYSLRPGDHIVVRPNETSFVGDMLQSMAIGNRS